MKYLLRKSCALQSYIRLLDAPAIFSSEEHASCPGYKYESGHGADGMGADGVRYTATMLEELSTLKNIRYLRIGSGPEVLPAFQLVKAQLLRMDPVPNFRITFDHGE